MGTMQASGRFRFNADQLDAVKAIVDDCLRIVRERDVGTLHYQWWLDETTPELVVHEKYVDSAALLAHAGNVAAHMAQLQTLAQVSIELYGEPSAQLRAAVEPLGVRIFTAYGGTSAGG